MAPIHPAFLDRSRLKDFGLLTCIWAFGAFVVNPIGDFPLMDDALFGPVVKHLVDTRQYVPPDISTMPLVTNVAWGAVFSLIFGMSFTVLRFSTLVASLLGIFGCYVLARDMRQPRWVCIGIALTLGLNPVYYALSYTFMTDVPYTTTAIWSSVFLARHLRHNRTLDLLSGIGLALAATFSRQVGLAIPTAFLATWLARSGTTPQKMLNGAAPLILCCGTLLIFNRWLVTSGLLPSFYYSASNYSMRTLTHASLLEKVPLFNFYESALNLGFFALPVSLCVMPRLWKCNRSRLLVSVSVAIVGLALAGLVRLQNWQGLTMPLPESQVLVKSGIGLLWLADITEMGLDHVPALPSVFWVFISVIALAGAVLFLTEIIWLSLDLTLTLRRERTVSDAAVPLFLLLCGLIYLVPYMLYVTPDRYVTPSLPFFIASLVALHGQLSEALLAIANRMRAAASTLLVAMGLFSAIATRDYLAWNRLRWEALNDLMQRSHIDPQAIDGGNEFNVLYGSAKTDSQKRVEPVIASMKKEFPDEFASMTADDVQQIRMQMGRAMALPSARYLVTFGKVPGYTVVHEYSYFNWLPAHTQSILILRRE